MCLEHSWSLPFSLSLSVVDFCVHPFTSKCVLGHGKYEYMCVSHYYCRQSHTHHAKHALSSIIYVFKLNNEHPGHLCSEFRVKDCRKKQPPCDKWVCGRVFIVGTCLRLNELVLGRYLLSSRNIRHKQIGRKSIESFRAQSLIQIGGACFGEKASIHTSTNNVVDLA